VEAAARGLADSNLTILNGTEGVNQAITGMVAQGLSILDVLRKAPVISGNGGAVGATPAATSPSAGTGGRRAS
jgi:flotillin